MKKSDYIFTLISIISACAFCLISFFQLQPELLYTSESTGPIESQVLDQSIQKQERQHKQHRYRRGRRFSPTGKPVDIEKIKTMIQKGKLSNKEALFYKSLEFSNDNEEE